MNSTNKGVKVEQIKLNETKAKNQRLREQINQHRKEMTSSLNEIANLKKNIKRNKSEAEKQNHEYIMSKKVAEEANNQIIALRAKHEEENERFENDGRISVCMF